LIAFIQWRRRPDTPSAWVTATFGTLALAVLLSRLLPERSESVWVEILRRIDVALIVLFPLLLYRFLTSLIRPVRWIWITGHALTGLALLGAFVVDLPEQGEPRSGIAQAYIYLVLIQWLFLLGRVSTRLWRAGRPLPAVVRRRMRTMSLGALGLAIAVVAAGAQPDPNAEVTGVDIVIQLIVLATGPFFLLGFAPPGILRSSWRQKELMRLREAETALMEALTPKQVARALLPHVTRLMGGRGSLMADSDGSVVDSYGLDPKDAKELAAAAVAGSLAGAARPGEGNPVISVPIGDRHLVVRSSRYTPYFGIEEVDLLNRLALLAKLALGRVEVSQAQIAQSEELREQARLLDLAQDAIFVRDIRGEIKYWNSGAERLYGYSAEEAVGQISTELLETKLPIDFVELIAQLEERGVWEGELKQTTRDGREVVVFSRWAMQHRDGEAAEILEVNSDITARKQQETFRDHFIANAAHELRTPLTSMLGFVDLLMGERGLSEAEKQTALGALSRSGARLSALIKDLLDLSRFQMGQIHIDLKPVEVGKLARETVDSTPPPPDKNVVVDIDEKVRVLADPDRLDQVLANLLVNAYRYGGSEIAIQANTNGDEVVISVSDTGPGVEPEIVNELFEPFTRGSNVSATGSGLGLAITKMLVEACGGRISYSPRTPTGANFQVTLRKAA
ncbi:MAG TPA: HAMP domain-containing sensor histidine kinase, partial [Actinomycetota bacterium]|nr:HAMP domain-containing sensor histidine kinase [Actinomycetota bacterium]